MLADAPTSMPSQSLSYACMVIAAMLVCLPFPWWWVWHRRRLRKKGFVQLSCDACGLSYLGDPATTQCPECGKPLNRAIDAGE